MSGSLHLVGASGWLGQQVLSACQRVAASLDHDPPRGSYEVVGDASSRRELALLLRETAGGAMSLLALRGLASLHDGIARRHASSPQNSSPSAGLQYLRSVASGAVSAKTPQNVRHPNITPITIRQCLRPHAESI